MSDLTGTLREGEFHPSAHFAYKFVEDYLKTNRADVLLESFASTALSGNRLAEICWETLRRFVHKEPISDRYLMGLAWCLFHMKFLGVEISEAKPT